MSAEVPLIDRCCRKSPKLRCDQFPAERRITQRLFVDMPPRQLPKSPASSSLYDASPHIYKIAAPTLGEFLLSNAKKFSTASIPIRPFFHLLPHSHERAMAQLPANIFCICRLALLRCS